MESNELDKVKKLLSLCDSRDEKESLQTMEIVSDILVRHNLSMQDVKRRSCDFTSSIISDGFWRETEDKYVTNIIKVHFFVEAFDRYLPQNHPKSKVRRRQLTFVGIKENVEVAEGVYHFLVREFRLLWKIYKVEHRASERMRQSYYLGLFNGIHEQLRQRRREIEKEVNTFVAKDSSLVEFVKKKFGDVVKKIRDDDARQAGFKQGKELRINRTEKGGEVIQIRGGNGN